MRIKKLFTAEQAYIDYAWSFINLGSQIWRDEDLPKLKPFFDISKSTTRFEPWSDEAKTSFDFYQKCLQEYAGDLFDIRDAIKQFSSYELLEFFQIQLSDPDGFLQLQNLKILDSANISFPFVFVGWIECGFDRTGKLKICFSEFVTEKDFQLETK